MNAEGSRAAELALDITREQVIDHCRNARTRG